MPFFIVILCRGVESEVIFIIDFGGEDEEVEEEEGDVDLDCVLI